MYFNKGATVQTVLVLYAFIALYANWKSKISDRFLQVALLIENVAYFALFYSYGDSLGMACSLIAGLVWLGLLVKKI
jgi:hypothetical protein